MFGLLMGRLIGLVASVQVSVSSRLLRLSPFPLEEERVRVRGEKGYESSERSLFWVAGHGGEAGFAFCCVAKLCYDNPYPGTPGRG